MTVSMDTPVGMAAWMLDHDADSHEKISRAFLDGSLRRPYAREIADNMTLYRLTNTATSSARLYWEASQVVQASSASGQKPPNCGCRWPSRAAAVR
jgi:hypothetical protein